VRVDAAFLKKNTRRAAFATTVWIIRLAPGERLSTRYRKPCARPFDYNRQDLPRVASAECLLFDPKRTSDLIASGTGCVLFLTVRPVAKLIGSLGGNSTDERAHYA
jgi:hypothetical protein